jgi:hypothetical protein
MKVVAIPTLQSLFGSTLFEVLSENFATNCAALLTELFKPGKQLVSKFLTLLADLGNSNLRIRQRSVR